MIAEIPMSSEAPPRTLSYAAALDEAQIIAMERDPSVFLMGVGVDDPGGVFGSTKGTVKRFGPARAFDVPISENMLTGACVGAALVGMRPIFVHARNDFLLLTLDQLCNHAAKWSYMSGNLRVPMVVRAVIGRGWGQGAQHSQSLQGVMAQFPGLQVVMPASPADAKGLLTSAIEGDTPTVFLEHRWSYGLVGPVPEGHYRTPIGKADVLREGTDVTLVAIGQMVAEATKAAGVLAAQGTSAEVLDLRSIRPWDREGVLASVQKTRRLVICDSGWRAFGVSGEIASTVYEELFGHLAAPIRRIGLPETPTPCAPALESIYYPGANEIVAAVTALLGGERPVGEAEEGFKAKPFVGAF